MSEARVEVGTVAWPWGADLDPDVLIGEAGPGEGDGASAGGGAGAPKRARAERRSRGSNE